MPITIATGVHRLPARTRGTKANPEVVQVDNAPTGSVSVNVKNRGQEAFFIRLDDTTLATEWVRVASGEMGYLFLSTTDPTNLNVSRPQTSTPRWIGPNTVGTSQFTYPMIVEIIPGATTGSGGAPVTPTCCTTTNADITIVGASNGLILTSPNGKQWRLGVQNPGNLSTDPLP